MTEEELPEHLARLARQVGVEVEGFQVGSTTFRANPRSNRPAPRTKIDVVDGRIAVWAPYELKDELRSAGGRWDPELRAWTFDATGGNPVLIKSIVARPQTTQAFDDWLRVSETHLVCSDDRYTQDVPEIPGLIGESWAHQRRAYADAMSRPATMLALGLGAGKTRVAIGAILNRDVKRVLILAPKSVVPVWSTEFAKHASVTNVVALDNGSVSSKTSTAQRVLQWADRGVTLTVNGVVASQHHPMVVIVTNYDSARNEPFRSWSLGAGFDMVVCDESQRIKAAGGVTSRYVAALGRQAKYRLCLSGTPAAHSPLDLYAQYRFLDPSVFGSSFQRFRMRYAVYGGYQAHEVVGYQNVAELNRKFHSVAFQVGREVLDLPDATEVTRYCELAPEGRRVYRELSNNLYAQLEKGEVSAANAMVALLRLQQLTGGYLESDDGVLHEVDHAKRDLLAEVLEEVGPDEPVVVFCRFRRDLDTVTAVAAVAGEETLELSGRANDLARWQAGEGRVLAVQIQAGGVGISLVRAAYVIFYSVGYSLSDFDQAKARAHRPGQDRPVTFVRLVAKDTVDEAVYEALAERRDVIDAVLRRRV